MNPAQKIDKNKIQKILARIAFILGAIIFFGMITIWIFKIKQKVVREDLYTNYIYAGLFLMFIGNKLGKSNSPDKFDQYSTKVVKSSLNLVIVFLIISSLFAIFIFILFITGNLRIMA
ncbi:MAG: hypothetical protein WCJ05_00435 [bacterium]